MDDDITIEIRGMAGIEAKLVEMGDGWAREAVHNALGPAGRVMQGAMTELAPVRTENGPGGDSLPPGALKADIQCEVFQKTVVVGPGEKTSHVAWWVERGHALVRGGRRTKGGRVVGHVPAHPFMRPAFDSSVEPAAQTFVDQLRIQLEAITPAQGAK